MRSAGREGPGCDGGTKRTRLWVGPGAGVRENGRMPGVDNLLLSVLGLFVLGIEIWALADAVYRPAAYYSAAGKWSKTGWVAVLAVAALLGLTGASVLGLLGLVAVVAALVYLVDVRPALREIRPGGPWA